MMFFLPALAGVLFALIGYSYRKGQQHGLPPSVMVLYMAVAGVVVFGGKAFAGGALLEMPLRVVLTALAAGIAQYGTIRLCGAALSLGPLSPLWCALNLVFVPVIIYSAVFLGERPGVPEVIGVLAAAGSVLAGAAISGHDEAGKPVPRTRDGALLYLAVLVGTLLCNSVLHGGIKDVGMLEAGGGESAMTLYGDGFFTFMYLAMGIPIAVDLLLVQQRGVFSGRAVWLGALAAIGSLGGLAALAAASHYPATVVFTLSAIISLAGGGLISVLLFGERVSRAWLVMMGLAALSVALVSL